MPLLFFEMLTRLFPGDRDLGYEAFNHKMYENFQNVFLEFQSVLKFLQEFTNEKSEKVDEFDDAFEFMRFLKKKDPSLYQNVVREVLQAYLKSEKHEDHSFGRPYVQGRARFLPEINYDLLEPVIERGQIWRKDGLG